MDLRLIIGIVAVLIAAISGAVIIYHLLVPKAEGNIQSLMGRGNVAGMGKPRSGALDEKELEKLKERVKRDRGKKKKKEPLTIEEQFFQAGFFTKSDQQTYFKIRKFTMLPVALITAFALADYGPVLSLVGFCFGLLVGYRVPVFWLDAQVRNRSDEILYYLPLVIEQVSIGVSSSLDIGPCLQRVVSMADERDSHNAVTELLSHAQNHVRSGVSLEDALLEVGKMSGHTELKHAFMSLGQVAKHGGEISRQLQELADAVASQRETQIEGQIKKLELKATGPVGMVFFAFMIVILIGFGLQVKGAFGG